MENKKNRLAGSIFYFAGPMDRIADRGIEWRLDMQEFLWSINTGVFNPCDKPINWGLEDEDSRQWRWNSREQARLLYEKGLVHESNKICDAVHEQMRDIVSSDLRGIDSCHAVILYIDLDVHMCGSYNEETIACLQRKPVITCCKQGKFKVPDWLWGICQHEMFFSSWDEVKKYIHNIAFAEKVNHMKRWRFLDMNKIYGRQIF